MLFLTSLADKGVSIHVLAALAGHKNISTTMVYVILPITVAPNVSPEKALNDNEKYKVVWQILNALRAHDERFDSTINRIGLGEDVSDRLEIVGVGNGHTIAVGRSGEASVFIKRALGQVAGGVASGILRKADACQLIEVGILHMNHQAG